MGNNRFKLSHMIPNIWFHKLRDMNTCNKVRNKTKKTQPITSSLSSSSSSFGAPLSHPTKPQRKSYYFTRDLSAPNPNIQNQTPMDPVPDPSRKSTKKSRKPVKRPDPYPEPNSSTPLSGLGQESCSCKTNSSPDEIFQRVDLPPIITKPDRTGSGKWVVEKEMDKRLTGKVKVKAKAGGCSPRVGGRVKVQAVHGGRRSSGRRQSLSESFAVVKASVDPQKDFKESMVEMIMENNIKKSKDLEELLACYLSLNSEEYHELIIMVFKQIWLESSGIE